MTTIPVLADGSAATDAVPRRIPYKGTLEKDGVAYTGVMSMKFDIYDASAPTTVAWTETQSITVYGGQFQALLGNASSTSATNLDTLVKYADDLYLSITLKTTSGDVTLSNKQRFYPVPYSTWATAAADFTVGDELTVTGAATAKSTLSVEGAATAKSTLTVEGALTANGGTTVRGAENTGSTAALTIQKTSSDSNKMFIDDDEIDSNNQVLQLNVNSSKGVTVGGAFTANSTATVKGGTLTMDNSTSNTIKYTAKGLAAPSSTSAGWKLALWNTSYGLGIESSALWYASGGSHYWYSTSDGSTFTKQMSLDNSGTLAVTGAIQPSSGLTTSSGIKWADNIGGGTNDSAGIRYYADSGEDTRLVIYAENDSGDGIALQQAAYFRILVTGGEVQFGTTKLGYRQCNTGYTLESSDMVCYKRYTSTATWLDAQAQCHSDGGHVCRHAEAYIIWGGGASSQVHKTGDWLGDQIANNDVLYVADGSNKSNMENTSDKTNKKTYVCCQNAR